MKNLHFVLLLSLLMLSEYAYSAANLIPVHVKEMNSGDENKISIKGVIFDAETGRALSSATIVADDNTAGSKSSEDGKFSISVDLSEQKNIYISYVGYETRKINLQDYTEGKTGIAEMLSIGLTPKVIPAQSVLVTGSIGREGITPAGFNKIKRKNIEENYITQDLPEFLGSLPSTTFYSESGNGLGYNYISIRGFDQRRISVAVNGVPQNEPEDHNVYWFDFPDILSSTELIQVQRGAGSGVIGFPSIGGSINIITSSFSDKPLYQISAVLGSYNTRKYTAEFSSGLVNGKYSVYAKLSKTLSSGYRNSSWIDYNAYHISAVRYDNKLTTQVNIFGGPISDGLAYNGLPKFVIKDRTLRKENLSYWSATEKEYEYKQVRRTDETEEFSQPHFEIMNEYQLNKDISLNSNLFMILGKGYYDYDGSWADTSYFRLTSQNGFRPSGNPDNALIRAQVENRQYGWVPRISIKHKNGELIAGAEVRIHRSLHWGSINYAANLPVGVNRDYHYYQYRGAKDVLNVFLNENYNLSEKFSLLAELQIASHKYRLYEEKFAGNDFSVSDVFINPRIGLNYKLSQEQNVYVSYANVSREPILKNYYDAAESSGGAAPNFQTGSDGRYDFDKPLVSPENMNDLEAGTMYRNDRLTLSANAFYMLFRDEIVKKGTVDRFGQPITGNMDKTVHSGIEVSGVVKLSEMFDLSANFTYSKNYILEGKIFAESNDPASSVVYKVLDLDGNRIAGFPDILCAGTLSFRYNGIYAYISGRYNGGFYSDNYDDKISEYLKGDSYDNKVDPFFTSDIFASYQLKNADARNLMKIYFQVNNVFDNLYAAYAIGKEFFPAAERNFIAGLDISL